MTPYTALTLFFEKAFSAAELRDLLRGLPYEGEDSLESRLLPVAVTPSEFFGQAVLVLERDGFLASEGPFWIALVKRRPHRYLAIREVAALWGVELPFTTFFGAAARWGLLGLAGILAPLVVGSMMCSQTERLSDRTHRSSICGDGVQAPGVEECDDGEANGDGKACRTGCKRNVCGDGDKGPGEACDDGTGNGSGRACRDTCRNNVCGDGDKGPGEACDDGAGNGPGKACRDACRSNVCGDGDRGPGEECDDGEANGDGKACRAGCKRNVCGDGDQGPGEACDDGAGNGPGRACRDRCRNNVCGDGDQGPGEACDDGNKIEGDGCTNKCTKPMDSAGPCKVTTTKTLHKDTDVIAKCVAGMTEGYLEAVGHIRPDPRWHGIISIRVCYLPDDSCPFVDFSEVKEGSAITQDTLITLQSKTLSFSPEQALRIHIGFNNPGSLSLLPGFRFQLKRGKSPRGPK